MADPTPADRSRLHPIDPAPFPEREERPVHLPVPLTSFVGREQEIAAVGDRLRDPGVRLVTLTGPGGVGKTRLAIRVAEEVATDFRDGVWFVALAAIRDPALVASAFAQALGVRESGARAVEAGLREFLRGRRALLVLDNFEHLLDAGPLVADLLSACVDLTVLVTSREVLRLSGEFVSAVQPLSLPVDDPAFDASQATACEAVQLFVERAAAGLGGFALTASTAPAVAAICARVDGLPLAIELAAARLRAVPLAALLAHLDRRLPLLHGGARDQPARLRTMRDAIAWSHDLLTPNEQRFFRRLSSFAGGFTLEAAEAVCGPWAEGGAFPRSQQAAGAPALSAAVLDGISSLVDKSLLTHMDGPDGEPRWAMLETVREFAAERLVETGEEAPIGVRHLAWCLATVQAAWPPRAATPADVRAVPRLDAERDNLRAGLARALAAGAADVALGLADGLAEYWYLRGDFAEGRGWLAAALALPGGDPRLRAGALYGAGILATGQRDLAAAAGVAEEGLTLAEAHGDRLDVLRARWGLAQLANRAGDVAQHATHAEVAVTLAREEGDDAWLAYAMIELGEAVAGSEPRRAVTLLEEARRLFAAIGDHWAEMNVVTVLGRQPGNLALTGPLWRRTVELGSVLASPWGVAEGLVGLAATSRDATRAARLLGAAEALRAPTGYEYGREILALRTDAEAAARARLGDAAFATEWAAGRAMPPDAAVAEALAEAAGPSAETANPDVAAALGLTRREVEVLRLLADGHSDREIAEALFISPKTVGVHISSIMSKLGVPSRAAAVAYAHRHGLA